MAMPMENRGAKVEHLSVADRAAIGKASRSKVTRASHGEWAPAPDRPAPLALLEAQETTRVPELVPIRHGRMAASPFAFYRGAANVFAADLAATPSSGLRVQLCGDAHLANFGGFASPERSLVFDLNDFDNPPARSNRTSSASRPPRDRGPRPWFQTHRAQPDRHRVGADLPGGHHQLRHAEPRRLVRPLSPDDVFAAGAAVSAATPSAFPAHRRPGRIEDRLQAESELAAIIDGEPGSSATRRCWCRRRTFR